MRAVDYSGRVIGRLTVLHFSYRKNGRRYWKCECTCGNFTHVVTSSIATKTTKSCGCLRLEELASGRKLTVKHGETWPKTTTEYKTWRNIQSRCYHENNPSYRYYGAIGITVCERWINSFLDFLADMGRKPTPKHSIDRHPNPAGNYEPGNCRWANSIQQRHNRRDSAKPKEDTHV